MLLWIIIALLTTAAVLAVVAPLARAPKSRASAAYAARVYRDQLRELERDAAESRISGSEAKMARAEIARRLIALDDEARSSGGPEMAGTAAPAVGNAFARRAVSLVALLGIPALSLGLYLALGAPNKAGEPLTARLSAPVAPNDVELLVAKVEAHLAKNPEDGRGWEVIAPVYLSLGRAADAAQAFNTAIRILGPSAERKAGLGEAVVNVEGGIVTAEARAAFEAAEALDPKAPAPRFYLALAAEQAGQPEEAKKVLQALLADAPAGAPWRHAVEEALAKAGPGEAQSTLPGPTREDVAAAQNMPEGDRSAMIESMVARLSARLKDEPDDVEGWLRLIRSYVVLGRAAAAADAARDALAGVRDDGGRKRVEALLADLRVTPAEATP